MAVDLSKITYIERITVGSSDPNHLLTQSELDAQLERLNSALNGFPRGTILSIEKSFTLLGINEHQLVLEWSVYHVGYTRKPLGSTAHE
ncbi:MAG TPA: hypothetical protein H9898_02945 [Candidatus Anaerobiospirillum stercoravium]|nr:hypothetical protein [Candidatus Anaerobiospirillum stercoravium]